MDEEESWERNDGEDQLWRRIDGEHGIEQVRFDGEGQNDQQWRVGEEI